MPFYERRVFYPRGSNTGRVTKVALPDGDKFHFKRQNAVGTQEYVTGTVTVQGEEGIIDRRDSQGNRTRGLHVSGEVVHRRGLSKEKTVRSLFGRRKGTETRTLIWEEPTQ